MQSYEIRPKLFAMVTTRDSSEYTPVALETFFRHTPLGAEDEVVLIDNDQCGESLPPGRAWRMERLVNPQPLGFAANINQMLVRAHSQNADLYFLNNDIVFTSGWLEPLQTRKPEIVSPLSNREVQYVASVVVVRNSNVMSLFHCRPQPMALDDYLGNEAQLEAIAEANRTKVEGYFTVMVLPFFCIKLPWEVMDALGRFDERYGTGGGEDYDYCLRAYLAGFKVQYALRSYLLHFGGKSTWDGAEERRRQAERQSQFRKVFAEKWGTPLFELILNENTKVLDSFEAVYDKQDIRARIASLMGERHVDLKL